MRIQQTVLGVLAREYHLGPIRAATPQDESKGIDGYLGSQPVSVKPHTYSAKALPERIEVPVVLYQKTKTHLEIDVSQLVAVLAGRSSE